MAAANLAGTDEERAEAALIAAAGKILSDDDRDVPANFVAGLFAYAIPEDLMRYDPRQLAGLAADAWSLLAVRKPGTPKIRFETRGTSGRRSRRPIDSVLEIVNDDMPFLVDSVLGELAERGVDVRFVVHPVFTVERDAAGRLIAFKGTRPRRRRAARELHPHPCRARSTRRRDAPRSSRRSSGCSPMCAPASRTGAR